ncbi:hypothetical protein [Neolewinella antarctica]|uniref:Lysine-specific metallo-endopeptidase domain-containing protein n=1 Tax=Neolewinella antarctica TaxID=442734 RepID=A0ABX0XGC1_9BACT|nr:hypothetical protein [Neolewinella antarctica]NJC28261.1 hypothetical protein [Neolewinella antarctica]
MDHIQRSHSNTNQLSKIAKHTLLAIILIVTIIGCESDGSEKLILKSCILDDCVTNNNSFLVNHDESSKSDLLNNPDFKIKMSEFWNSQAGPRSKTEMCLPAWGYVDQHIIKKGSIKQYVLPFISPESNEVNAFLMITEELNSGNFHFNYVLYDEVATMVKYNEPDANENSFTKVGLTRQAAAKVFIRERQSLFNLADDSMGKYLSDGNTGQSLRKCLTEVAYPGTSITNCWHIFGGAQDEYYLYSDCETFYVEFNEDCGGGGDHGDDEGQNGGGGGGQDDESGISIRTDEKCNPSIEDCIEADGVTLNWINNIPDQIVFDPSLSLIPCARSVLDDYTDLKHDLRQKITDIFGDNNPKISLTFKAGYTGSNYAITNVPSIGGGAGTPVSLQSFYAEITLSTDPNHSGCSKDLILSTIVHETIHAYYDYIYARDGNIVINEHPYFGNSGDAHHFAMAADYVAEIAGILRGYNPNLSSETAEDLSWAGLEGTGLYENMGNQALKNRISGTLAAANCRATNSTINSYNYLRCP